MKVSNAHFAKLYDEYHEIERAETNVDPVEELAEVEMRKQRMALKDELWKMLSSPVS